jgi:hypothetical protein
MRMYAKCIGNLEDLEVLGEFVRAEFDDVRVNLSELQGPLRESADLKKFVLARDFKMSNAGTGRIEFDPCASTWALIHGFTERMMRSASENIKKAGGQVPYSLQPNQYDDNSYHNFSREEQSRMLQANLPSDELAG